MNTVKHSLLAAAGILAMILVAGCFNPAAVDFSFPEAEASGDDSRTGEAAPADAAPVGHEPFEVTIYLDAGGGGREVLGPSAARIKGTHIRNFIQVFLLDTATNKVVEIFEHRRLNLADDHGTIVLYNVEVDKTYKILMLQGHWERKYRAGEGPDDDYDYDDDKPPTLLYAGVVKPDLKVKAGLNPATLDMYPIWVDTEFIPTDDADTVVQPVLGSGAQLVPGAWDVQWTVKRYTGQTTGNEESGFIDLTSAQVGSDLFKTPLSSSVVSEGTQVTSPPTPSLSGNTVTLSLPASYTGTVGQTGSVNFNLKYAPFSLSGSGSWTATSGYSVFSDGVPEWIIRNGVNDEAQDGNTDFDKFGNESGYNGNGAVAFTVQEFLVPDGITVHKTWYVASNGSDTIGIGTGAKTAPLKTVQKAVEEITAAYVADNSWRYGSNSEAYAAIVILGEVPVKSEILIDNRSSIYPPILLTDGSLSPGGKLKATTAIGNDTRLLDIWNGAQVTLAGNLVLEGLNTNSIKAGGVAVNMAGFTMNGGVISGNSARSIGGGVMVSGTFIMNDGVISGNYASNDPPRLLRGGGVFLHIQPKVDVTFKKNGGTIYGYDSTDPVNSNFVKEDSSGNFPSGYGHAIYGTSTYRKEDTVG
ncbi:MAG: hypothetical protein LBT95_02840, partial [Treponema sp.]|nr:hypothetical protein [Treponema sp.]